MARRWTADEDATIIAEYLRIGRSALAQRFGCGVQAVERRAQRLGVWVRIRRPRIAWTEERDGYIAAHIADGCPTIARHFGDVSAGDVRSRAQRLGLIEKSPSKKKPDDPNVLLPSGPLQRNRLRGIPMICACGKIEANDGNEEWSVFNGVTMCPECYRKWNREILTSRTQ